MKVIIRAGVWLAICVMLITVSGCRRCANCYYICYICSKDTTATPVNVTVCSAQFGNLQLFNDSLGRLYNCQLQTKTRLKVSECNAAHTSGAVCF